MTETLFQTINDLSITDIDDHILMGRILDRYRWPIEYIENPESFWSRKNKSSIEVFLENGTVSANFFLNDNYVHSEKVLEYYTLGHTVIISKVEYISEDVAKITRILNEHYRDVTANIYWGKGTSSISFPLHDHNYHVLVKNVSGKSIWTVGDKEILLENQYALYFDAFTKHSVNKIIEPKLSITFNLPPI